MEIEVHRCWCNNFIVKKNERENKFLVKVAKGDKRKSKSMVLEKSFGGCAIVWYK